MNLNCLTIGLCLSFSIGLTVYYLMCLLGSCLLHIFCSHFLLCIPLPPPFFLHFLTLRLSVPLALSLTPLLSLSSFCFPLFLFFLVSFEVLNNERAALPVKLIEKSRLKLLGTVHHSWILSSGPHVNEKGGGSIRSIVSMRWQWLHRALIPLAETQTTSAQHSWWALISSDCFFLPLLLWMLNLDISWYNV